MLESSELEFIMEAHNGLSAKIVQETGNEPIIIVALVFYTFCNIFGKFLKKNPKKKPPKQNKSVVIS